MFTRLWFCITWVAESKWNTVAFWAGLFSKLQKAKHEIRLEVNTLLSYLYTLSPAPRNTSKTICIIRIAKADSMSTFCLRLHHLRNHSFATSKSMLPWKQISKSKFSVHSNLAQKMQHTKYRFVITHRLEVKTKCSFCKYNVLNAIISKSNNLTASYNCLCRKSIASEQLEGPGEDLQDLLSSPSKEPHMQ